MAGRVTHLQDWAAKEGGWEQAVTLKEDARIGLEKELERKLTDGEISAIEKAIAPIKFRKTGFPEATAQDVKRSLGNIGKLPSCEAVTAYRKSDSTTTALIDEAMYFSLGIHPNSSEFQNPSGETITQAATEAFRSFNGGGKGGRPPKNPPGHYRDSIAKYALRLWVELGGRDCSAWAWDDNTTPIVSFLSHLASIVDDEMLDLSTAAELLNNAAKSKE